MSSSSVSLDPAARSRSGRLAATVGLHTIPGGTSWTGHGHDVPHITVVVAGKFVEEHARGATTLEPGAVRLAPAASHDLRFGPQGAVCLVIELHGQDWPAPPGVRFLPADPDTSGLVGDIVHQLRQGPAGSLAPAVDLDLETLILGVLARSHRHERLDPPNSPPAWLRRLREQLAAELSMSVSYAARQAGVHRGHLARAFRHHYGEPMSRFVQRRRLARAVAFMNDPELSLAEVAFRSGYADQSHLTRNFRRRFGQAPGAWRRQMSRE